MFGRYSREPFKWYNNSKPSAFPDGGRGWTSAALLKSLGTSCFPFPWHDCVFSFHYTGMCYSNWKWTSEESSRRKKKMVALCFSVIAYCQPRSRKRAVLSEAYTHLRFPHCPSITKRFCFVPFGAGDVFLIESGAFCDLISFRHIWVFNRRVGKGENSAVCFDRESKGKTFFSVRVFTAAEAAKKKFSHEIQMKCVGEKIRNFWLHTKRQWKSELDKLM